MESWLLGHGIRRCAFGNEKKNVFYEQQVFCKFRTFLGLARTRAVTSRQNLRRGPRSENFSGFGVLVDIFFSSNPQTVKRVRNLIFKLNVLKLDRRNDDVRK